jgi:hypothetical protein
MNIHGRCFNIFYVRSRLSAQVLNGQIIGEYPKARDDNRRHHRSQALGNPSRVR